MTKPPPTIIADDLLAESEPVDREKLLRHWDRWAKLLPNGVDLRVIRDDRLVGWILSLPLGGARLSEFSP